MRLRLDRYVDAFLTGAPAVWTRPASLAKLGSESFFAEPYMVRSPHRVYVGDEVRIDRNALLSVVETYGDMKFDPTLRIGDDVIIGTDLHLHCAGGVEIGSRVAIATRVYIGDSFRDYEDPAIPPVRMPMADPEPVRICEEFGTELMLADDRSLSRDPSPFGSVQALADYVEVLLREEA